MNPRSGSSLITKIFHAHGCWVGSTKVDQNTARYGTPTYPTYEWLEMKWAIKPPGQGWKTDGTLLEVDPIRAKEVKRVLSKRNEKHVIYKGLPDFHNYFKPFKPKVVKIWRSLESVLKSQKANAHWAEVMDRRIELMQKIPGPWVFVDEVVKGNLMSLQKAFDHCGIVLDHQLAIAQIEPDLWHENNHA